MISCGYTLVTWWFVDLNNNCRCFCECKQECSINLCMGTMWIATYQSKNMLCRCCFGLFVIMWAHFAEINNYNKYNLVETLLQDILIYMIQLCTEALSLKGFLECVLNISSLSWFCFFNDWLVTVALLS